MASGGFLGGGLPMTGSGLLFILRRTDREARENGGKSIHFGGEDFEVGYARYCLLHLSRQGLIDREKILDILEEINWK